MAELRAFLVEEVKAGRRFFPPADRVFNAMALTPFDAVRVVILGQDPYHGPGQAMGLCFSVPPGVPQPPSLQNIFKELASDLGVPTPSTGDLTPWAERGVLLLNAVLTVSPRSAGSHAGKGWERFTDRAVAELSSRREGIVFLLWGRSCAAEGRRSSTGRATTFSRRRIRRLTRPVGFLRMPAFLQGQRAPGSGRPGPRRMAVAVNAALPDPK